jgi:hypothetical protein
MQVFNTLVLASLRSHKRAAAFPAKKIIKSGFNLRKILVATINRTPHNKGLLIVALSTAQPKIGDLVVHLSQFSDGNVSATKVSQD